MAQYSSLLCICLYLIRIILNHDLIQDYESITKHNTLLLHLNFETINTMICQC